MKKSALTILIILIVTWSHAGWADDSLLVFAGAGMRTVLDEIAMQFEAESGIRVVHDYEGSGRLASKILAGQKPDIFIPGAEKWAKQLKEKGHVKSYFGLACHVPVILTPANNTKVNSLEDFTNQDVRLVLGDPKACAIGRNASRLLEKAGLDEAGLNVVSRGATVKQLVRWIEFKNADATIAWHADGFQNDKVRIVPIPEEVNCVDIIPVCEMMGPPHPEAAAKYLEYLAAHGGAVFEKNGFKITE
jgi:molybdate transport system substrate-binding protein